MIGFAIHKSPPCVVFCVVGAHPCDSSAKVCWAGLYERSVSIDNLQMAVLSFLNS